MVQLGGPKALDTLCATITCMALGICMEKEGLAFPSSPPPGQCAPSEKAGLCSPSRI